MMKRIATITFLLLFALVSFAQTDSTSIESKIDSLYGIFNDGGDYNKIVEEGEPLVGTIEASSLSNSDSMYISLQALLAKCYYRIKQPAKAADAADKAAARLRKIGQENTVSYAIITDNASLYYLSNEQNEKGLARAQEALRVMENFPDKAVSEDMSIILLHVAEGLFYNNKFQDAIVYEIRGLNTIDKLYGQHSEEYLNELPYLSKYYTEAGEQKKAEEIDEEVDKLQKEYDNGDRDVPDPDGRDLSSAEECHKYNYEAYRCITYYLDHKLGADYMNRCVQYITRWSLSSPDVKITLGKNESKLLDNEKSMAYFVAYLAGCSKYALDNNDSTFTQEMYFNAMIDVLNFYIGNSDYTGKVKYLQQYVDLYNKKGLNALRQELLKNFPDKEK